MNVYFACSITGGRQDELAYQRLVATLQELGHHVPTAQLASSEAIHLESVATPEDVYVRDVGWIKNCDLLVAEVSTPSHGVGYEIAFALSLEKKVFCLHRQGGKVSKMILGNPDPQLTVRAYTSIEQAVQLLNAYLSSLDQVGVE
jgi:2'-deoxynucleoside 5'-phosphate N-hydrolase